MDIIRRLLSLVNSCSDVTLLSPDYVSLSPGLRLVLPPSLISEIASRGAMESFIRKSYVTAYSATLVTVVGSSR